MLVDNQKQDKNLASKGRYGDTMLAHVNPQEAAMLQSMGGAGTVNPQTGLREFYDGRIPAPSTYQAPFGTYDMRGPSPPAPEPFDRSYADLQGGGMGVYKITGYTVPSDQTFANIPLVTKYDPQGGFNYLTLKPGEAITPDPSQPNIISVPRLDASGNVLDWGIVDTNNQDNGSFGSFIRSAATDLGPILSSVLTYYMPGITGAFAPSLSAVGITDAITQSVVSSALANTVVAVAQGASFDDALKNAVISAVVSTGSPEIAKDINSVISNEAVTNAIVSAGASAAKTALNGGSQSDIENNFITGLIGSGVASATDGVLGAVQSVGTTDVVDSNTNGVGVSSDGVSDVTVSNVGVDNDAGTFNVANVLADSQNTGDVNNASSSYTGQTGTSDISILPETQLGKGFNAETTSDFADLTGANTPASGKTVLAETTDLPESVIDIAESLSQDTSPVVLKEPVGGLNTLAETATPTVDLDTSKSAVVSEAPVVENVMTAGSTAEQPVGGLNAVAPQITKPLIATVGNLIKSGLTKNKPVSRNAPRPRPTGGLQAVRPKVAAPAQKVDVAKLIPIQKAAQTASVAPPKTLPKGTNLTPITNIASLTSQVKKTG